MVVECLSGTAKRTDNSEERTDVFVSFFPCLLVQLLETGDIRFSLRARTTTTSQSYSRLLASASAAAKAKPLMLACLVSPHRRNAIKIDR